MRTFTLLSFLCWTHFLPAQTFSWARQLGGTLNDGVYQMVTDAAGNIYTVGEFDGTMDADPGSGTFMMVSAGLRDIFISKLDAAGNFVWAKQIGSTASEQGYGIAVATSGNVYIVGSFRGTVDFDPAAGEYLMTSLTSYYEGNEQCGVLADAFILKLDNSGAFTWARQVGGNGTDKASAVALDAAENVFVVGEYTTYHNEPLDLDPTEGVFIVSSPNWAGAFMLKLDTDGGFGWARQWESTYVSATGCFHRDGCVNPASITIDGLGNVVAAGHYLGTVDFDPGAGTAFAGGANNVFVLKLTDGGDFMWMRTLTNPDNNAHARGTDVVTDAADNVITVGSFDGSFDFDPGPATKTMKAPGGPGGPIPIGPKDAFVWKLTSGGNYFWAGQMGGNTDDFAHSVDVDANGNIYTTGIFSGTADFDPSSAKKTLKSVGADDVFISKLTSTGSYVFALRLGNENGVYGKSIDVNTSNNILLAGGFSGTIDFNPGAGISNMTAYGGADVFILNLSQGALLAPSDAEPEIVTRSVLPSPTELSIWPNPAQELLRISFISNLESHDELLLMDITGRVISTQEFIAVQGMNTLEIAVQDLAPGQYLLMIRGNTICTTRQFVKS